MDDSKLKNRFVNKHEGIFSLTKKILFGFLMMSFAFDFSFLGDGEIIKKVSSQLSSVAEARPGGDRRGRRRAPLRRSLKGKGYKRGGGRCHVINRKYSRWMTFNTGRRKFGKQIEAALIEDGRLLSGAAPADSRNWCGGSFSDRGKRLVFYRELMLHLAKRESSFKAGMTCKESFGPWSTGLFQISPASARGHGCGKFHMIGGRSVPRSWVSRRDLADPDFNIKCAVHIFSKQISKSGYIASTRVRGRGRRGSGCYQGYCGASSYWAPFRTKLRTNLMRRSRRVCSAYKMGRRGLGYAVRTPRRSTRR